MPQSLGVSQTTHAPLNFVGPHPSVEEFVTLASNGSTVQTLAAGTVLGKVTASGKYVALAPAASDGSQTAVAVLAAQTVVPATGDEKAAAHVHGSFIKSGLNFGAATTPQIATAVADLKAKTLFVIDR